jgi:CheY-like chemotaxis protein
MTRPLLLLVDDAPDMGVVVTALGRRAGCEVACRPDLAAAWQFLQERRPDLVLLDVNLPGASGLELCKKVRATPALARLPVALFTHWGLPGDIAAGLEAGADYLFSKELVGRPADWQRRLAEILDYSHGHPSSHLLGWGKGVTFPDSTPGWAALVNQALRHPAVRQVAPEVMRVVLRRALQRAFTPGPSATELEAWVMPGGATLSVGRVPRDPPRGAVAGLFAALAEQVWCLLGAEATAPFREALSPRTFVRGPNEV